MNRVNNKGETVVEVLIAIAAVAGVLAASYYLINRSYRQSLDATERVAAIKAAESKIEILRTIDRSNIGAGTDQNPNPFCLDGTGSDHATSSDLCDDVGIYKVTLKKTGDVFESTATWDGLQAGQTSTIYYKP